MPERPAFRLGELLMQAGAINKAQLNAALEMQRQTKGRLGSILVELGHVDERTLAGILAEQLKIPSATATQLDRPPKAVLQLVAKELASRYRAVPIRIDGDRLWVAMADPTDRDALSTLSKHTQHEIRPMVAPDVLIDFALDKHYGIKRRARVVEVRDASLLDVAPSKLAVYDSQFAPPPGVGFLDERKPAGKTAPPPIPRAANVMPGPPVPKKLDADALRGQLLSAPADDDIFERLLDALSPVAARLAVLLVRSGVLVAQKGRGIDARSLQLVRVPVGEAPSLLKLLEMGTPYVGPLPSQLGSLFQEVGESGLILPLTLGKRPVGVLIGGKIDPKLGESMKMLERIAGMVDLALHAGHLRSRLARS